MTSPQATTEKKIKKIAYATRLSLSLSLLIGWGSKRSKKKVKLDSYVHVCCNVMCMCMHVM